MGDVGLGRFFLGGGHGGPVARGADDCAVFVDETFLHQAGEELEEAGGGNAEAVSEFLLGDAAAEGIAIVVVLEGPGGEAFESLPGGAGVDEGGGGGIGAAEEDDIAVGGEVFDDGAEVFDGEVAALGDGA